MARTVASAREPRPPGGGAGPRAAARSARPLLKWAGGKRQLLPVFRAFYPARFGRYFEPFLGSGAVFFDLHASGRLDGHAVELSDGNPDLIGCYQAVRDRAEAVLAELAELARCHARDGVGCYYAVRERFNSQRQLADSALREDPAAAAMFIYLNRTGFNGLFRVNAQGAFNVPAGRYTRPRIHDPGLVRAVRDALRRPHLRLRDCSFGEAIAQASRGDFLYFDPPYAPLSPTADFGAYTATGFSAADQQRLCEALVALVRRGCQVMLSNSSAPAIVALYADTARAEANAGLALWALPARRAINSRAEGRGPVAEVLLTNLRPSAALPPGSIRLC